MVVIINETMAKKLFPGENPIGRRLITGIASIPREIVGVSGDVRAENLSLPPGAGNVLPVRAARRRLPQHDRAQRAAGRRVCGPN